MKRLILPVVGLLAALAIYFLYAGTKPTAKNEGDTSTGSGISTEKDSFAINPSPAKTVQEERFTLHGSQDYAALKTYFEPLAEKGDPYARRIIAQIYDYCAMYSNPNYHFNETLDVMIKQKPENKARLEQIRKDKHERCSTLDNGLPITKELIDFSWAQASAAKDSLATFQIATQLQIRTPDQAPQGKVLDSMIDQAINEADPESIFAMGELLALNGSSIAYADTSGPINQYAWQITACRRGGAQMCGPNSRLMTTLCLGAGDCTSPNFEAMVRNSVPNSQTELLNQALARIEQLLQQRKPKT